MRHRNVVLPLLALAAAAVPGSARAATPAPAAGGLRDVVAIGNNWDGTADIVDAHTFQKLLHLNIVPDLAERRLEAMTSPYYLLIYQLIGEGHDQLVDDMFTSKDGRYVYVSRPSLADVVSIDLATRKIVWRAKVDGARSDHMAVSADGSRLLVSASTANVVDVIDTKDGRIIAKVPSGDSPHESNFSKDGSTVFHASIGRVYAPTTDRITDLAKGEKRFELIDTKSWTVRSQFDLNDKLKAFGRPDIDGTIRPMAISPDERFAYFQTSFHHGLVEYDLKEGKVTRALDLPARTSDYVLNSAHHGLAMNREGTKMCAAGTIDDYIAIIHRDDFSYKLIDTGDRPYWATDSADGQLCFVSIAEDDYVSVVSYAQEKEIAQIPVGRHPQRIRVGQAQTAIVGAAPGTPQKATLTVRTRAARVAAAGRTVRVPLTATAKVTQLSATLRRAGTVVARGRAARADGRFTLALRGARAIRPGRYQLVLRGTTADGVRAVRTLAITVAARRG